MTRFYAAAIALVAVFSCVPASAQNVTMIIVEPEPRAGLQPIDYADAATTAIAIATGEFIEANPIAGIAGDGAAPLVALALKIGAKRLMVQMGASPEDADYYVGTGSAFGVGNNMALLLGGTGPLGVAAGVLMALAYLDMNDPANPKSREPNWDYWHGAETR